MYCKRITLENVLLKVIKVNNLTDEIEFFGKYFIDCEAHERFFNVCENSYTRILTFLNTLFYRQ